MNGAVRTNPHAGKRKIRRFLFARPITLALLYCVAVTLPLILSWSTGLPPRPVREELASGLGMLAFSIILIEFVLSGRVKSISNHIGMDVTMRVHQLMARTALAFALVHPFLYGGTPSGGQRPWDITRQLTITTDFVDLSSGIAAFLILPSLVLLAIGRTQLDYKYETWRFLHGAGAFLVAVFLLHHTLSAGRYGSHPQLVWLWSMMTAIAVTSLLYVYVLLPLLNKNRAWVVTSVARLTPKQWELKLEPSGHSGLDYKAGQFAWLNIGHNRFSINENPFSISSAPSAGAEVSFMIKELGDFTSTIDELQVGTLAYLNGPYGSLCVDDRLEPGIGLIAGGVGLAPLLGIIRQLKLTNDPRQIKLIYGNREISQIAYRDELNNVDVTYILSEPPEDWQGETGLIDGKLLDHVFSQEEFKQWIFVLCGPAAMMDKVEDHLLVRGAKATQIISERFDYD
jgi:predicted ferric reductase